MFDNEQQTKALIEQILKEDTNFATAYNTRKDKSFDGFMQYFYQCAQDAYIKSIGRKSGCMTHIDEADVRCLLVHYWTEDSPKVGDITISSFKGMAITTPSAAPSRPTTPPATPKPTASKPKTKPTASKKATIPAPAPAPQPEEEDEDNEWL